MSTSIIYATPNMLPYEEAHRANTGTSFVPEKRARDEQEEFARVVNANCAELSALAIYPAQRQAFDEWVAWFVPGYLAKTRVHLAAKSRCVSTMIAGPANFNVRRAEKANESERRRCQEFLDWHKRAIEKGKKAIRAATPSDVSLQEEITDFVKAVSSRVMTANRASMIHRAAARGDMHLVNAALDWAEARQKETGVAVFAPKHKVWGLRATATAPNATGIKLLAKGNGFELVRNYDADRLQILFDAKPDEAMRVKLKATGWRWSPTHGAWQRQLTKNAEYSAQFVLGLAS